VIKFFFHGLRRSLRKENLRGVGIHILNNRMHGKNWRPTLPSKLYPSLKQLIVVCWQVDPDKRLSLDDIKELLINDVHKEVDKLPEPTLTRDFENFVNNDVDYDGFVGAGSGGGGGEDDHRTIGSIEAILADERKGTFVSSLLFAAKSGRNRSLTASLHSTTQHTNNNDDNPRSSSSTRFDTHRKKWR